MDKKIERTESRMPIANRTQNLMSTPNYVPHLSRGSRTIFAREDHAKSGQYCTVLNALPNPSKRSVNQWYDVRFDDGWYFRCHEWDLKPCEQR